MKTVIQMDTREKIAKKQHITTFFDMCKIQYVRSKLYVGDYTRIDNQTVCVDVKQNLAEVYSNVITDHIRFKNELKRAENVGICLVILIEEDAIERVEDVHKWVNPRRVLWERGKLNQQKPPVSSARLQAVMETLTERYGVQWIFCNPCRTGELICEILGVEI